MKTKKKLRRFTKEELAYWRKILKSKKTESIMDWVDEGHYIVSKP